jgi:hypothetical protein
VPNATERALEQQVATVGAPVEGGFGRQVERGLSVHCRLVQLELLW